MRIGIDIDDTICYSIENILPYICKYYNLDYELESKKCLPYDAYHILPNYLDFAKEYYDTVMPNAQLIKNANVYINELSRLGHEIIFVTARNYLGFSDPYKTSSEYLDKYNIHYDKLIVSADDKGRICVEENIDIFIDDSIRNCENIEKADVKVWLFDNYFNRDDNRFIRVNSWEEVYDKIKNQLF